jgi:ABC-type antimicrobial peptide transport system permease subunit
MASLVLVAGCTTLIAVVLVHYERRRREMAIRLALGAPRRQLVLLVARELAAIVAAGLTTAAVLSRWSLAALPSLNLPGGVLIDRLDLSTDWRVIAAGAAAAIVALAAASFLPISRFTRSSITSEVFGATATASASSLRLRQLLLSLHVAATMVLLITAGLFVRAVEHAFEVGAGFDVERTVFLEVQLTPPFGTLADYTTMTDLRATLRQRLEEGLAGVPGVDAVASGRSPIGPSQTRLLLNSKVLEAGGERRTMLVGAMPGSPQLLAVLGVPVIRGRTLNATDATARPQPIVVTESLARTLWRGDDPVGQLLTHVFGTRESYSVVVGVARDFAYGSLSQASSDVIVNVPPFIGGSVANFVLRTTTPEVVSVSVEKLVHQIVPNAPRLFLATGEQVLKDDLGRQRLGAWFFSGFGLAALILGLGGVFGLVAYLAESRSREFALRLALGATPMGVLRLCMTSGLAPVVGGTVVGAIAAGLLSRTAVSLLPGISLLDPALYLVVVALCVIGAGVSAAVGAWRLRSAVPSEVLRSE